MAQDPSITWKAPDNLTEEQMAEAQRALEDLVKLLAQATARACHKLRVDFDMDAPQVARELMTATFGGLLMPAQPPKPGLQNAAGRARLVSNNAGPKRGRWTSTG